MKQILGVSVRAKKLSAVTIAALLFVGLTSCSSYAPVFDEPEPEDVSAVVPEPEPEPEPEPQVLAEIEKTVVPVIDADGYTMDIIFDYKLVDIEIDPSSDKPGLTTAYPTIKTRIALSNTTAGRDIPFKVDSGMSSNAGEGMVSIVAGWNAHSPMCNGDIPSLVRQEEGRFAWKGMACGTLLAYARIGSGIADGQTVDLETFRGGSAGWYAFPEEHTDYVTQALVEPDFYRLDFTRFNSICEWDRYVWSTSDTCQRVGTLGFGVLTR